jgi:isoleucyl-tRNA synthetase
VRDYPLPFKTCIVLGHVGDKEGRKESKSKGNYTPPEIILDRVRMEFGTLDAAAGESIGLTAAPGEVYIAREDLEGMDLDEGTRVIAYRQDKVGQAGATQVHLAIKSHKKLPRRVALLSEQDRVLLDLSPVPTGLKTRPQDVPRSPKNVRVTLEDETTKAPGSDAFRWFFYASSPPWTNTRHSLTNVRTLQKDFLIKLRNVYSFFTIYANIDGWSPTDPAHAGRPAKERALLDRWMLSELAITTRTVRDALEGYLSYDAAMALVDLAESVSNWYVRRSRARFWGPGLEQDKRDAYATLYETLVTISRLIAPFTPFFAEEMYQNLVARPKLPGARPSVHLDRYPEVDASLIDERLAGDTRAVRDIVSLGLSVRTANRLKVRQPLSRADVVFNDGTLRDRLAQYVELIKEELNVHDVHFMFPGHEEGAVSFKLKPNFRALGPKLGKNVQAAKKALETANGQELHAELSQNGKVTIDVAGQPLELTAEDLAIQVEAAPGFAAETGRVGVVVLHTTLTEALIDEGLLREVLSRVQAARKDAALEFTQRIRIQVDATERLLRVVRDGQEQLKSESLATSVELGVRAEGVEAVAIGDEQLWFSISKS